MRKLLCALMTLSLLALFSSCEKDETNMTCSVEYDFRLPDLLVELFDAYVEYTDNGQTHTEMMKDGKWSKNFSYKWEGDKTNHNDYGFNALKITLKPKVDTYQFKGSDKILIKAKYFKFGLNYEYISKSDNSWSSSSDISDRGSYKWSYSLKIDIKDPEHSFIKPIDLFNNQSEDPYEDIFWIIECNHKGSKCDMSVTSSVGDPDED